MGRARRLRMTIVLGALTALGPFTVDMYLPAFPAVAASLAAEESAVQATLTGTTIGIALGQLLVGPWSDRVGRRLPLVVATSAHVIASLACAVAPDIVFLTIARVLMGAAAAAGGVVAAAMVRDLYSGVPMMRLASQLAMINGAAPIIAPLVGSAVLLVTDWRGIFVVLAMYATIIVAATIAVVPETLPAARRSTGGFAAFADAASTLLRDKVFVTLMVLGGMVWACEFTYLAGSSFLLQIGYGFDSGAYALVFALNAVGFVGGTQVGARLAPRVAPQKVLLWSTIGLLVAAALFLVLERMDLRPAALVAMWFTVAAVGVSVPCSNALAMNRIRSNAGTAAALLGAANFGLAGIAPPIAALGPGMGPVMVVTAAVAAALAILLQRMPVGWNPRPADTA